MDGFRVRGDRSSANYSYALFNLGTALNRSGHPAEAIPYLQERLQISSDRPDVVRSELVAAQQALAGGSQPQAGKAQAGEAAAGKAHGHFGKHR